MKSKSLAVAIAVAVAVVLVNANPASADIDLATGGGLVTTTPPCDPSEIFCLPEGTEVSFAATSGPNGEDPRGEIQATNGQGFRLHATVTCLVMPPGGARLAWIGGLIDGGTGLPGDVLPSVLIFAIDGDVPPGPPSTVGDNFGIIFYPFPVFGFDCIHGSSPPVERGNVTIHNATE